MRIRQYVVDESYHHPEQERQTLSERELCQLFNVTRPTVRRALKDLIDDEYLIIRPGLGTFTNPAKARHFAENKEALFIGIILGDGKLAYYNYFYWHMLTGIGNEIVNRNCYLRIINLINSDMKTVDEIKQMRLDGLIWILPPPFAEKVIVKLNDEYKLPVISVNRRFQENVNYVSMDFEREGYDVTKFLLDKGLRKIVYAGFKNNDEVCGQVLKGAQRAFKEKDIVFNSKFVLDGNDDAAADLGKMIDLGVEVQAVYTEGTCLRSIVAILEEKQIIPFKDCWLAVRAHNVPPTWDFRGVVIQYPIDVISSRVAGKMMALINGSSCKVKELINAELLVKNEKTNSTSFAQKKGEGK
jgi:hypothetical protein